MISREIENQKEFLNQSFLTDNQFSDNAALLAKNYIKLIFIKLDAEKDLINEDREKIYDFYKNMVEGIRKNATLGEANGKNN